MNPIFSIIVPVYNAEKYLLELSKNLLNQEFANYEVIFVNDGSNDNSKRICEDFLKNQKVRLINKENGGVSSARNAGIREARGKYIIFVDSDDSISTDMCKKYNEIIKIKNPDIILSNAQLESEKRVEKEKIYNTLKTGEYTLEELGKKLYEIYKEGLLNPPWSKCFKREIISNFDETLSLGEDLLFNLKCLEKSNKIYYLDLPLYTYKVFNSMLSTKYREDGFEVLRRVYLETIKKASKIWGNSFDRNSIDEKYLLDVMVTSERIARTNKLNLNEKKLQIKRNMKLYNPYECVATHLVKVGIKWKIYNFLIKNKMYLIFIIFSNLIKRRKKCES